MNQALQTVFHYHERTKHAPQRYARSLGYMDWSTQPNPFRQYKGTEKVDLPLAINNNTPPYHLLDTDLPSAPLCLESISQLLQFSLAIAAHKEANGSEWAVRCNASSGNLHPTESYLILPPLLKEQNGNTTVMHYAPKKHELEILAHFQSQFWDTLPQESFILGLSSISWREAWKYGERAFRYTQLDVGHAWHSVAVSAKMLGWKTTRVDSVSEIDMTTLFGLNQNGRFFENELPDMLLVISPENVNTSINIDLLTQNVPLVFEGIANRLSPNMHPWNIIPEVENATSSLEIPQQKTTQIHKQKGGSFLSRDVILNRRSVHIMHKEQSQITKKQFHTLLNSVASSLDGKENATHLVLFIHRVKEYEQGLYILIRNDKHLHNLHSSMHKDFLWQKTKYDNLYLLEKRDLTMQSKAISCTQEIAADGAFSLGMLCEFSSQINAYGAHRYKELYWECGMIGQELYLEATSLGLSGTGIGCFLDDMMHNLLGIKENNFQILYHFTVGVGNVDSRIMTKPAYPDKEVS